MEPKMKVDFHRCVEKNPLAKNFISLFVENFENFVKLGENWELEKMAFAKKNIGATRVSKNRTEQILFSRGIEFRLELASQWFFSLNENLGETKQRGSLRRKLEQEWRNCLLIFYIVVLKE